MNVGLQELELRIERSERSRPAVLASEANGKSKSREKDEEKTIRKNSAGESSDKAEQEAIGKLKLAKILAEDGKTVRAKDRLKEIIASYPETKAAEEARHLLKKLDQ